VGIYLSAHPLDGYKFEMDNYGMTPVTDLEKLRGRNVRIAGFITDVVHATTKKGSKFGKMVINDYSGNMEIVLWEKNYVSYGNFLLNGQKLMITGVYDEHKYRPGTMEFQIQGMMLLDEVRKTMTKRIHLALTLDKVTAEFANFMEENTKKNPGSTELIISVKDPETEMAVRMKTGGKKIVVSDELISFLAAHNEDISYSIEKT
jgi:DNA polymerase III subunit alpha